jgi:hypothetical protein
LRGNILPRVGYLQFWQTKNKLGRRTVTVNVEADNAVQGVPVSRAPAIERNMDLAWYCPEVVGDQRLASEMDVGYAPSDGVVGNVSIRCCN